MALFRIPSSCGVERWTGFVLILLSAVCAPVLAAEIRQLTLNDGSVVTGEIESAQGGTYTVRSPSLGTITVRDSEIRSIETPNSSPSTGGTANTSPAASGNPQLDALQQRILGDDSLMSSVTALQDDPQVRAVLKDPEIMEALRAGNVDALKRNPKLRSLMDNPRLREINRKLAP